MLIALTGGIACGKSAVAAVFATLGYGTLSADALAHEALDSVGVAAQIRERFGAEVLTPEGKVNRTVLGGIVFGDAAQRRWLEGVVHPAVVARWRELTAATPERKWVVEVPLLFEAGLDGGFDVVVCVHCTEAKQLARMASRGLSDAEARLRLRAQLPLEEKVRRSAFALFNEGSRKFLQREVEFIHAAIAKYFF
jgi:dephospho-CoA kinase